MFAGKRFVQSSARFAALAARRPTQSKNINSFRSIRFYSEETASDKDAAKPAESQVDLKAELAKLQKQIEEKDAKLKEMKDSYLRALAETENVRTRSATALENSKKFAIRGFSKDMLDTVDVLTMALANVPAELALVVAESEHHQKAIKAIKDLSEGVELTLKNLLKAFERNGVVQFNPLDEKFDPNTSDAVYQVNMPGKTPGHVFVVEKTGYKIHDSILRPAQVGVVAHPN